MNEICTVHLSKQVIEDLKKVPDHIAIKLHSWIDVVINRGLNEVKKISGYHHESLKGGRFGQHSVKLDPKYRAIYIIEEDNSIRFVEILSVSTF